MGTPLSDGHKKALCGCAKARQNDDVDPAPGIAPLNAFVVVAEDWLRPDPRPFLQDRRLLKSALLYADFVDVRRVTYATMAVYGFRRAFMALGGQLEDLAEGARREQTSELFYVLTELAGYPNIIEPPAETAASAREALHELQSAAAVGALFVPGPDHSEGDADWWKPMRDPSQIPVLQRPPQHVSIRPQQSPVTHPRLDEALIATRLLGQLEAFPDASMDVLLDVRNRLEGPRVHFRAAMSRAANALAQMSITDENVDASIAQLRVETVDPALIEIREALHELGVRRTLLRLAKDKFALTSVGATVTMAAGASGAAGVRQILQGLIAAPLLAAGAEEAEHRATVHDELRSRPYWLLHEADQATRSV
jgi:hypothetical protein